jgi:hypothetical protein
VRLRPKRVLARVRVAEKCEGEKGGFLFSKRGRE